MNRHTRTVLELGVGLGLLLTVVLTALGVCRSRVAAQVRADTIRLHVLANSDTMEDQLLKLRVRDAILEALPAAVTAAETPQQAAEALRAALPSLHRAARTALNRAHSAQAVTVRLESTAFPARAYDGFALPGGTYTALRVELGAAQGRNWFCVLYPALCVSGVSARYPTAEENALVFGDYILRSALWDAISKR